MRDYDNARFRLINEIKKNKLNSVQVKTRYKSIIGLIPKHYTVNDITLKDIISNRFNISLS